MLKLSFWERHYQTPVYERSPELKLSCEKYCKCLVAVEHEKFAFFIGLVS